MASEERRRAALVESHLHLLDLAADHWQRKFPGLDRDDLHSAAYLGLRRAAEKYEPERGAAFSTCAWWWLRAAIQEELPALLAEHGVRLPRHPTAPRPHVASMDASIGDSDEPRSGRIADEEAADPFEAACRDEDAARVRTALGQLRFERDRRVIRLRFGIGGGEPMTLRAIGAELGVSVERARQLETRALRELCDLLATE